MRHGVRKESKKSPKLRFWTLFGLRGALFGDSGAPRGGTRFRTLFGLFWGSGPEGPGSPGDLCAWPGGGVHNPQALIPPETARCQVMQQDAGVPEQISERHDVVMMTCKLSGPLNRLNAILSLLHSLDHYRTRSAIARAIGRPLSLPISHPNTVVGVLNRLVLNRLGGLNRAMVAL